MAFVEVLESAPQPRLELLQHRFVSGQKRPLGISCTEADHVIGSSAVGNAEILRARCARLGLWANDRNRNHMVAGGKANESHPKQQLNEFEPCWRRAGGAPVGPDRGGLFGDSDPEAQRSDQRLELLHAQSRCIEIATAQCRENGDIEDFSRQGLDNTDRKSGIADLVLDCVPKPVVLLRTQRSIHPGEQITWQSGSPQHISWRDTDVDKQKRETGVNTETVAGHGVTLDLKGKRP